MSGNEAQDYPVVVIPAAGETLSLGTYYDCRTLKIPPGSPNTFTLQFEDTLELPVQTLKYDLKHMKETKDKTQDLSIGLEVAVQALFIELTLGSVKYSTTYNSKLENDHLQIFYSLEHKVQRLLPTEKTIEAITSLGPPPPTATHIITEVYTGIHLEANILIINKSTTKVVEKTAYGLGLLIIGPLSKGIEAALSALLDKPSDEVTSQITIDSTHADLFTAEDSKSIARVLQVIRTKFNSKAEMRPLKMMGVPIQHFLLCPRPSPGIPMIPSFLLELLMEQITTLKDYADYEDDSVGTLVPSQFYSKQVQLVDRRLNVILADENNMITKAVKSCESRWNWIATPLYLKGKRLVEGISNGTTMHMIQDYLVDANEQFDVAKIKEEMKRHVVAGREQLYRIQANDINVGTQVDFTASTEKTRSLQRDLLIQQRNKGTGAGAADQIYLTALLETHRSPSEGDPPPSLFLQLYSFRSNNLKIIVKMPNALDRFALTLSSTSAGPPTSPTIENTFTEDSQILKVLGILSVGFGSAVSSPTVARFYQALASRRDLALPFHQHNTTEFIAFLLEQAASYPRVTVFETFLTLKLHLLNAPPSKVIIVLPTQSLVSLGKGIEAFDKLYRENENNETYDFVVGDFDILPLDGEGPLLLVFREGKIISQCMDWLDCLNLEDILRYSPGDFTNLNRNYSYFHPNRNEVLVDQLLPLFVFSFYEKPALVLHQLDKVEGATEVREALSVCLAALETQEREMEMVKVLSSILLQQWQTLEDENDDEEDDEDEQEYDMGAFERYITRKLGWSAFEKNFTKSSIFNPSEEQRKLLREPYLTFLSTFSPVFSHIVALLRTIELSLTKEADAEENEEPFKTLNALVASPTFMDGLAELEPSVLTELKRLLSSSDIKTIKEGKILVEGDKVLLNKELRKDSKCISILQQILSIIPEISEDEAEETATATELEKLRHSRKMNGNSNGFDDTLREFIMALDWEANVGEIEAWLSQGLIFKILPHLNQKLYPSWHRQIVQHFETLNDAKDFSGLMSIVEFILTLKELKVYENHFIWANPAFSFMLQGAIDNSEYSKRLFQLISSFEPVGSDYCVIPSHIPFKIVKKLKIDNLQPISKEIERLQRGVLEIRK